ncbi:MAG: (deoxy)nucleoside triphosphate pyrophosphohydrolase [Bacteroidetes bacterium]|nr:(deoxy)nucleoside triphosphate pyrophosphohydrolase [Bacteroidota bacterium]
MIIDVTCAIIIKQGKILATQRSEKMKLPLKWEFPGGKIEHNETAIDCIIRELKEELNIEIEVLKKLSPHPYDYGEFIINLIPFVSIYLSGTIVLNEHKEYKWLSRDELKSVDWAPADIPVLAEFLNTDL